jgi:hypothetical protein
MGVELYAFRFRDPVTGRWVKARYRATMEDIAATHTEWEIIGAPEMRSPMGGSFNPYRVVQHAELRRLDEVAPQINPHFERPPAIDSVERFLTLLFLRRYVTYCARRRKYAAMNGAAALLREIRIVSHGLS